MPTTSLHELIPALQAAIGPVILISGVGLILLTLTNRFGRAVDRSRQLARELREQPEPTGQRLAAQVAILYRRARLLRRSIILAAVSVLLAALLIILLFVFALFQVESGWVIGFIFIACMLCLIAALLAFIRDIHLSIEALDLELNR